MSGPRRSAPQLEVLPGMEAPNAADAAEPPALALTTEQEDAVARRSEPLALSAAAGSGKTSVLVERFVRAVREDGVAPGKILAITFTERAAGELRARVRARLLELGDRESARDTEAAFVGTFHGFCARLLRTHPLAASLDPEFSIIDEGLAGRLRGLAFKAALAQLMSAGRSEAVDLLAAYGVDRVRSMIEQVYAELRSRGARRPRLPRPSLPAQAAAADREAGAACALLDELLEGFAAAYARLKSARGAVDFDDLELLTRELLAEHEAVRVAWSQRFELLMVDEFQDTNPRQLAILQALDRGNLFTVGDELQSIYGFRHADVALFRTRRAELRQRGASLALTSNFRSREPLLDVVNAVFAERFADYVPLVAGRGATPTAAEGVSGSAPRGGESAEPAVELLLTNTRGWEAHEDLAASLAAGLPHAQPWRQAEAWTLAGRIAELVQTGRARAGEVAVLLRASGDLDVFERALQLRGLRTLAAVGAFWGSQQIGDLISYLRALANPLDEEALYGALASPLGGCSRDCLGLLADAAASAGRGAWETALDAVSGEDRQLPARLSVADRDALASFCTRLRSERRTAPLRRISELIERAIDGSGYREYVLGLDWGERRLANVHKLLRLARRFEATEGRDLRGFLDHVEHLEGAVKVEPDAPVDGVEPDAVRLMTVHAAKGLEFPVVCLADLGRQPNTQTPDLLVDGERIGLRLMRLDGAKSKPALDYDELCSERRRREADEEDRILYVAMTRARDRLLLSGAVDFERWPTPRQAVAAISWLGPALCAQLPALLAAGEAPPGELRVGPTGSVSVRCRLTSPSDMAQRIASAAEAAAPATEGHGASGAPEAQGSGRAGRPAVDVDERALRGPTPTTQLRSPLSYTSISELERCGYRYYLERVLGLPEERAARPGATDDGGLEARSRGTLIHRLMESLDFSRPSPPSPEDVSRCAGELGMRVGEGERVQIAGLIAAASTAGPAARLATATMVRREHPFAFSLEGEKPLITGVIDLLATEAGGGHVVVDYKSDRVGPDVELGELVGRDYAIQRLLYALAVLRDGATEVEIIHWFLERPEQPSSASYASAERPALERELADRIERAGEDPFAVSSTPHRGLCLTCPGRLGLCSWGDAETLREDPVALPDREA